MSASSKKFRKVLDDLKRRPEDAAQDLGVSKKVINNILKKDTFSDLSLIKKAVKVWPVNYSDFFILKTIQKTITKYSRFRKRTKQNVLCIEVVNLTILIKIL